MANTSKEWSREPTSGSNGKTRKDPGYHIAVGHNNGLFVAGHHNTITTNNVFNVLIESPRKDTKSGKKKSRPKKKNKGRLESDYCQGRSRNYSEPAEGKNSATNSLRKESESNEDQSSEEKSKYQHAELKDQDFVTTSEDELTTDEEKASTARNRFGNEERFSRKGNCGIPESESESAYNNSQSGDSFSPLKVALRQSICFAACIMICLYFQVLSFLPFMFWLIFVANNLLASFSCIKLTFKTIDCRDMPTLERPFISIARLQVDFFIKEDNILQRLVALLLCVSVAFVSSQVFGCATCLLMQTIVMTIISTIPYVLFRNNSLLPFPLTEHCRVFNEGIHSSGNGLG